MKVAILNEMSTCTRNADIVKALEGIDVEVINVGMKEGIEQTLNYLQTGFLTGLLINLKRADFVIGGCGTGTGYINAALCFPNVSATMCLEPIDAFLFPRINAGNCISLALNKGYGWGAPENLRFMFERLFAPGGMGAGYPAERKEIQNKLAQRLTDYSQATHRSMAECVKNLETEIVRDALHYPGVWELVDIDNVDDAELKAALIEKYNA